MRCNLAPHIGHVSNFCSLKHGPLEPGQPLSDQGHARRTVTHIQPGYPAELLLEPSDRASLRRESGTGRKHYAVLREVDSMTGETIRYSWSGMRSRNSVDAPGVGLIGRKHVERNEID